MKRETLRTILTAVGSSLLTLLAYSSVNSVLAYTYELRHDVETPPLSNTKLIGGTMSGMSNCDWMMIDVDQATENPSDQSGHHNEVFAYVDPKLGGLATGHKDQARAEILLSRSGTLANGKAWMKSSSGAKVSVEENGDVIISVGN